MWQLDCNAPAGGYIAIVEMKAGGHMHFCEKCGVELRADACAVIKRKMVYAFYSIKPKQ
jgi:hypothetical protein